MSHERQQKALAASKSLQKDLDTIRSGNSSKFATDHPKEHHRLTKKEAAQKKRMEKSYQRQRARAEDKAMRLQASKNVGLHPQKKKKKKSQQINNSRSSGGFGSYQGPLPSTRSHPGKARQTAGQHMQQEQHDGSDHELNKHRHNYSTTPNDAERGGREEDDQAPASVWIAYIDSDTKYTVYFNEETNESSWNPPDDGNYQWVEEPPESAKQKLNGMDDPEGLGEWRCYFSACVFFFFDHNRTCKFF
jgi:hypothetical protein